MKTVSQTNTWKQLNKHAKAMLSYHLRDPFENDKGRFSKYSIQFNGLLFDYSKLCVIDTSLGLPPATSPKAGI